jgi:DNA repair protein RadD
MIKQLRTYQLETLNKLKKRLKETTHPLLVTASVGSGKSIIIAELLLSMEKSNYKCLCLTLNSTLIQQNHDAYKDQGGNPGIYCAGLNAKDTDPCVIFASPHSVAMAIKSNQDISKEKFRLIVIDESHNIDPHDRNTMFQRIINHYSFLAQSEQYSYRVVGLTGTPYRGKGHTIIGEDQFFKEEICNISTSWLIKEGYLTPPQFGITKAESYDFSNIRVNNMGRFNATELQKVIDENSRLTAKIMKELQLVMQNRVGAFIFAATRKHCEECAKSLPDGEWAIVTGETPHEERKSIINRARKGEIRYLINVNCLVTGVDISSFDCCCWVRPTESLVLYTQGIGRILRLHEGKISGLVLDYAGNLNRHGDIDDPIINAALQPQEENEKDYVIPCLSCSTLNTVNTRRCIGTCNGSRCLHFFEWKDCESCGERNDKTSRLCRSCNAELIDPNAKLTIKAATKSKDIFTVVKAQYWIADNGHPVFHAMYTTPHGMKIYESFVIRDSRTKNIFYGQYVRNALDKPSQYYPQLHSVAALRRMLNFIRVPSKLECSYEVNHYKVHKRIYYEESIAS